jgi:hypothetical protein
MRYTIHAEQRRAPVEFEYATPAEAVCKAWSLMVTGATGLYIYDDETDDAYWPNEFAGLVKVRASGAAHPEAPDQETAAGRQMARPRRHRLAQPPSHDVLHDAAVHPERSPVVAEAWGEQT